MSLLILPPAFSRATLLLLPDRTGYLVLLPTDGLGVECPTCNDGRAMGLAVLRQAMPSARWYYRCLFHDDVVAVAA